MLDKEFNNLLKFGNEYENITANYYCGLGYNVKMNDSNIKCSEYDMIINNDMEEIKIEVKSDRVSAKTGNLFIEFESNNIPSGISVTESNFYVYYIINNKGYNMYIIPTLDIKMLIDDKKYFRMLNAGYKKYSRGYLFRISLFEKYKVDV